MQAGQAARDGGGALVAAQGGGFMQDPVFCCKDIWLFLPAPLLPAELSSIMAACHSTPKQNKAQPPLSWLPFSCFQATPVQLQLATTKPAADSGTTKLHQQSATQSARTAALKQNLQCHESRWFCFLHPREFCTNCWQAATHGPVLNRSAWPRSGQKGVVGFLAEPGTMPKAAKRLSCFHLAYFTSPQRQLSRTCLVGAFLSPELIPVPKVQSLECFS